MNLQLTFAGGVRIAPAALVIHYSRSSGPGGQNVNKLNTKAALWLDPAGISGLDDAARNRLLSLCANRLTADGRIQLIAETRRTQEGNRQALFEKLENLLLLAQKPPKPRRKTRPTRASARRRLESKRRRSEIKSSRRPSPRPAE